MVTQGDDIQMMCIIFLHQHERWRRKTQSVDIKVRRPLELINLSFLEGLMLRWFPSWIIFNICFMKQHIWGLHTSLNLIVLQTL